MAKPCKAVAGPGPNRAPRHHCTVGQARKCHRGRLRNLAIRMFESRDFGRIARGSP